MTVLNPLSNGHAVVVIFGYSTRNRCWESSAGSTSTTWRCVCAFLSKELLVLPKGLRFFPAKTNSNKGNSVMPFVAHLGFTVPQENGFGSTELITASKPRSIISNG